MCEAIIPCFDNNRTPSSRETLAKLQLIKGGCGCFFILNIDFVYKSMDRMQSRRPKMVWCESHTERLIIVTKW